MVRDKKRVKDTQHPYVMSCTTRELLKPLQVRTESHSIDWTDVAVWSNLPPEPPDLWDANDDIALINKIRDRVAGSDFNAGIVLAEAGKTARMIGDAAFRIASAWSLSKKGRFDLASRVLLTGSRNAPRGRTQKSSKTTASNWLELQYGWKPLLSDVYAGSQFLAYNAFGAPLQQRVRVSRTQGGTQGYTKRSLDSGNDMYTFDSCYVKSSKQIIALIKEKDVIGLAGLKDPDAVLWEMTPNSFILDWFIPISNYFSARGAAQYLTGEFVITKTFEWFVKGPPQAKPGWEIHPTNNGSTIKLGAYRLTRDVTTSLYVPLPVMKPLAKAASWLHATNALALLVNLKR